MIPQVKDWQITLDDGRKLIVQAPTKLLAKLSFRQDYPRFWGYGFKVGLKRKSLS